MTNTQNATELQPRMTREQLIDAARTAAKYLPVASAQLMTELANRLDYTSVALCEAMSQRKSLASENAGLKAERKFFMYSDDSGFETYKTQEEAIKAAQEMIDSCREDAYDGWPEEADTIRWGVVIQQATETDFKKPAPENGWVGSSDYKLLPEIQETPATSVFLAEVRAEARNEGINYAASRLAAAFNHGFVDKPLAEVYDVVRMILDTKEELASSMLPAADGLSGEYAEAFLEDSAAQLRKGVQS